MKKKFQTAVLLVLAATLLTIVAIGVYVLLLLADPDNVFTLILAAFILIEFTLILSALGFANMWVAVFGDVGVAVLLPCVRTLHRDASL